MRYAALLCLCFYLGLAAWGQQVVPDLSVLTDAGTPFHDGDRLVCFGDSITQGGDGPTGYVGMLRSAFSKAGHPAVTVINAGIGGNRVPDLQARLEHDVLAKAPTVVFIYIGINDVRAPYGSPDTPTDRFANGLRAIITALQQRGIVVVLATPTVVGEKVNGGNAFDHALDVYADTSRALAKECHLELCDLRTAFVTYLQAHNPENVEKGILTEDSIHLTPAGYAIVAREAAKSLVAALKNAPTTPVMRSSGFIDTANVTIGLRPALGDNVKKVTIRYTLDGTEPTGKSPVYRKPFAVKDTTTVTARAFRKDVPLGFPISATFTRLLPRRAFVHPEGGNLLPGLAVDYYEGTWDWLPDFAALTPVATTTATTIDLTPRKRAENFALRFHGYLDVPATAIYHFTLTSDDGSRLQVDNEDVVNNDGAHPAYARSGQIALEKGLHAITITYFQGSAGAALDLKYNRLGQPEQAIAPEQFRHIDAMQK